ncbi:MAG TPA: PEP-CTERM sorting domain-containing protein [Candidatus Brocadiia bacterium]|nr:PEP-CTERM sorting domain-containing protein [Candidatus Brocadiia bacterium]
MYACRNAITIAALAMLVMVGNARAYVVTSITTEDTYAPTYARSIVFPAGMTVNYDGLVRRITSATDSSGKWWPTIQGDVYVRRNTATETFPTSNPNQSLAWNVQISRDATNINVHGRYTTDMAALVGSRSIVNGSDNVFTNEGNTAGNNNNIERIDFIFPGGLTSAADVAFVVMERGVSTAHDAFRIAAITGLAGSTPTNYGNVVTYTAGSWGTSSVTPSQTYEVLRYEVSGGPNLDRNSATVNNQPIGGNIIETTTLVSAGTTIYGYSLFAPDVTGTGLDLVDWTNATYFPTNTPETNDGIDLVMTGAVTFVLPEPSSLALFGLGLIGTILRRRKG